MTMDQNLSNDVYPRNGTLKDGQIIKGSSSPYSPSQIVQWLAYIGFSTRYPGVDSSPGLFPASLENLEILTRLQLLAFLYENTEMHYTAHHSMDVSFQGAFKRLMLDQKGSYCYGLNSVFLGMLLGLGYRAYSGGARVNRTPEDPNSPDFTSLLHMVIFVQPFDGSNKTYVVDVGYGSTGLVRPILLSEADSNTIFGTTPTERHRLTRGAHPLSSFDMPTISSARSDLVWNLEVGHAKGSGDDTQIRWQLLYAFSENECFPIDAENASFVVSVKPEGLFWSNVICIRWLLLDEADTLDEEAQSQAAAEREKYPTEVSQNFMFKYVMAGKEVKRNIGSNSITIRTLMTELDRIQALREIFRLDIPDEAQVYIKGRKPALD